MKYLKLIILFCIIVFAQKPTVIVPDGLIPGSRKEDHKVDLSSCDQISIKVNLNYASISNGVLTAYSFKKYGNTDIIVTCTIAK